jgi:hypothetical protein
VEQYSTWFPGMADIFISGIDSIPTPPALESPEEEAEGEMLHQQAQNLLEMIERRKVWESLQASRAKVTKILGKTGSGQARSGQTGMRNIAKGPVDLSDLSESEWSDGPKEAKKKDKIGASKSGSTLQPSSTLNRGTTMNTRSMGTRVSVKLGSSSQTSGALGGGTALTRSMTMTRAHATGSALQDSGALRSGIKKKGSNTVRKADLAKNIHVPVELIELSDSSDETKKSESTSNMGTGKKRAGKTRSPGQNHGALRSGTRTRSMAMTMVHKAGPETQNSGSLSGCVKEMRSISKSLAHNAESAKDKQDPIELSDKSDNSTRRDSTKSLKGKHQKPTHKAGFAPQDPGNLSGATTLTIKNIIESLDAAAASNKFETNSRQPTTTEARTPTATQTSIHLKNLGDDFLSTSDGQYLESEPHSPTHTLLARHDARSKVIPINTLKICTDLEHQAIVPVVETVPPSSSKSNGLR